MSGGGAAVPLLGIKGGVDITGAGGEITGAGGSVKSLAGPLALFL